MSPWEDTKTTIEALAAAICNAEASRFPGTPTYDRFMEEAKNLFRREAEVLSAALATSGWTLVQADELARLQAAVSEYEPFYRVVVDRRNRWEAAYEAKAAMEAIRDVAPTEPPA